MDKKRVIRIYSPDNDSFVDIKNIPDEITAKEFLETIFSSPQFQKYKEQLKIKQGDAILNDNDFIGEEEIHLIHKDEAISSNEKAFKISIKIVFWIFQIIPLFFVYFHQALVGILVYIIGFIMFRIMNSLNPQNKVSYDFIDGIRLFFVSLSPDFQIENAVINPQ